MTNPALAVDSPFGRLYRKPTDTSIDDSVSSSNPDILWQLVKEGTLVPSVTNVIDVSDKPFLKVWAARLSAEAAFDAFGSHPDAAMKRPQEGIRWAKTAHERSLANSAALGSLVHDICEKRVLGDTPLVPKHARPYIKSWENFISDYSPKFLRAEATCFGSVDGEGYAGTGDIFVQIGSHTLVGDYKTGRKVGDSAAQQLSALANSLSMVTVDGDELEPVLNVDGGIVIQLSPRGYRVFPVDTSIQGEAWAAFGAFRNAWNYHARMLASRSPIFLLDQPQRPEDLAAIFDTVSVRG